MSLLFCTPFLLGQRRAPISAGFHVWAPGVTPQPRPKRSTSASIRPTASPVDTSNYYAQFANVLPIPAKHHFHPTFFFFKQSFVNRFFTAATPKENSCNADVGTCFIKPFCILLPFLSFLAPLFMCQRFSPWCTSRRGRANYV